MATGAAGEELKGRVDSSSTWGAMNPRGRPLNLEVLGGGRHCALGAVPRAGFPHTGPLAEPRTLLALIRS